MANKSKQNTMDDPVATDTGEVHTVERQPVATDTGEVHTVKKPFLQKVKNELGSVGRDARAVSREAKEQIRRRALPTREEIITRSKSRQEVLGERAKEKKLEADIAASNRKVAVSRDTIRKANRSGGNPFGMPDPAAFLMGGGKTGGFGGGGNRGPSFDLLNMGGGGGGGNGKSAADNLLNLGGGSGGPGPMETNEFFYGRKSGGGGGGGGITGGPAPFDINEFYFGNSGGGGGKGGKGNGGGKKKGNPFTDQYGY